MVQVDVFSFAAAVTALLLAAALLVAYAINRRLRAFVWWAGKNDIRSSVMPATIEALGG